MDGRCAIKLLKPASRSLLLHCGGGTCVNITTLSASFPPSLGSSLYLLLNAAKWLCIIYNLSSESHRSFPSSYCPFHLLFSILFCRVAMGEWLQREGRKERRRREGEELQCREKLSLLKRQLLHLREIPCGAEIK